MKKKTENEEEFALWCDTLAKMEVAGEGYRAALAVAGRAQAKLRKAEARHNDARQKWNRLSNTIMERRGGGD